MKTTSSRASRSVRTVKTAPKPQPAQTHGMNLKKYALAALAGVVAVFAVYGQALSGPFLLDDQSLPYMQYAYATAPLMDWIRGIRPVLMLSYWLNFQASGT